MEIIKVFLLAMTPVGELRIAIPVAIFAYQMSPFLAYFISVLGNIFVVLLILLLLNPVSDFLSKKLNICYSFFSFLFSKTRKNHSYKMRKYGLYALVLFVAIPLPITGGWTASLVSFVFGIPFKKAFPLISLGALISGAIVLFVIKTGVTIERYFSIQVLLGVILLILLGFLFYKSRRKIDRFLGLLK